MGTTFNIAIVAFILINCLSIVHTATIYASGGVDYSIGTPGTCSLRGAILNANANRVVDPNCIAGTAGIDTIIVSQYTTLQQSGDDDDNVGFYGDLDITESVNIVSLNGITVIDGNRIGRVFDIHNNVFVTLSRLIIRNGEVDTTVTSTQYAAGVRAVGTISLNQITFEDNTVNIVVPNPSLVISAAMLVSGTVTGNNITFSGNKIVGTMPELSRGGVCMAAFSGTNYEFSKVLMLDNKLDGSSHSSTSLTSGCMAFYGVSSVTIDLTARNNIGTHGGALLVSGASSVLKMELNGALENNYAQFGGAIYFSGADGDLVCNRNPILNNVAAQNGGFLYLNALFTISKFTQISNNVAVNGGGVFIANGAITISDGLAITQNTATENGGFICAYIGNIAIATVGVINYNIAANGGVVYVNGPKFRQNNAVLFSGIGEVAYNNASVRFSVGGVAASYDGTVVLSQVATIHHNNAYKGGVVFASNPPSVCRITDVSRSIFNNTAYSDNGAGGVMNIVNGNGLITRVFGNITYNLAPDGDGGVIFTSGGNASMTNIVADIAYNFGLDGGVLRADSSNYIGLMENITGNVHDNNGYFDGGIMSCKGDCYLRNNVGKYYNNVCKRGCIIFSENATAFILNHVGGFEENIAFQSGGVANAPYIVVDSITGALRKNAAQIDSGGVFYSEGGFINLNKIFSFEENVAKLNGGAIASTGAISISNVCHFDNNTAQNGEGGIAYSSLSIEVNEFTYFSGNSPDNFVSPDTDIYQSDPMENTITLLSASDSAYFAEVTVTGGNGPFTYLWSNGDTTAQSSRIRQSPFSVTVTDASYCASVTEYTIPNPFVDAGEDQIVCPNNLYTLGGTPSGKAGTAEVSGPVDYLWEPTSLIYGPKLANPQTRVYSNQTFTLTVSDKAIGRSSVGTVRFTIPTIKADAGPDVYLCKGDEVVIGAEVSGTVSHNLSVAYVWSPSAGLNNNREANPVASPGKSTEYRLMVTTYECPSLYVYDSVTVTVLDRINPTAVASPTGADSILVCPGASVRLGGTSTGSPGPLTYLWSPSTGLDNVTSPHPIATPTETTTYTVRVFNLGGCGSAEDSVTLVVSTLTANAGVDFYNSGNLGGNPTASQGNGPYQYSWAPTNGISNPTIANPYAAPFSSTKYTVTVSDRNGCAVSSSVNVISQSPQTTGTLHVQFTIASKKRYDYSLSEAEELITRLFASNLNVPQAAVYAGDTKKLNETTFFTDVDFFEWISSGVVLANNILQQYNCDGNLPCSAPSNTLVFTSFSALQFLPGVGVAYPDKSFSHYNSLNTVTTTLYMPDTTTYSVPNPPETSFFSIVSRYSTNLITSIVTSTSATSDTTGNVSSDSILLTFSPSLLIAIVLYCVL